MSNKLEKLRASQAKDMERLELLQARLKEREEEIHAEENEQLAEHFADLLAQKRQSKKKKEDSANETV